MASQVVDRSRSQSRTARGLISGDAAHSWSVR